MGAWERICCPIDFSPESSAALDVAAELAGRLGAELLLVHVRNAVSEAASRGDRRAAEADAKELADARRDMEVARQRAEAVAPGRVRTELLAGDAWWEIVKLAEDRDVDLLVVGTHGRSGFRRLVVGSVAERVLREAPCPVLAVRSQQAAAASGQPG